MKQTERYRFKVASENWEFEQIYQLNYRTFVEEIPQHETNERGILVDRFDQENEYVICLDADRLVGMLCIRDRRPFSLDQKLKDLDSYLPPGRSVCEIRLLAVEPDHRNGIVLDGLMKAAADLSFSKSHNLWIISGSSRQLKLYRHLGFVPFGPVVGTSEAAFQPMYLTLERFEETGPTHILEANCLLKPAVKVNLLPGPVGLREGVLQSAAQEPVPHRSARFHAEVDRVKNFLCSMVGAKQMEILLGSGTLANDVIAGQLSLLPGRGLILSNGEFGERLLDHATRFNLAFDSIQKKWGEVFDEASIRSAIRRFPNAEWLWAVHCETSTGVLNDLASLKRLCAARGLRLCLDCISTIGIVPLDLSGVYLASGVSGKGLAALPGLSMVFYNHAVEPAPHSLPRYLDLGLYRANCGVPFTHSSNLVAALAKAIDYCSSRNPFERAVDVSTWLRSLLRTSGFDIVAPDETASPAVITIALPDSLNSDRIGAQLERKGFLLSYQSGYLLKRNWIQICLMGEYSREDLQSVVNALEQVSRSQKAQTVSV